MGKSSQWSIAILSMSILTKLYMSPIIYLGWLHDVLYLLRVESHLLQKALEFYILIVSPLNLSICTLYTSIKLSLKVNMSPLVQYIEYASTTLGHQHCFSTIEEQM